MKIEIVSRLTPFSHLPGTFVLIPKSPYAAQIFPALIRFFDLSGHERKLIKEVKLEMHGPLSGFTIIQNLERGVVSLLGEGLSYHLLSDLTMIKQKTPPLLLDSLERLSLGSHKKQEWERIKRERDFFQLFPLWLRLGTLLQGTFSKGKGGVFSLLEECEKAISSHRPENILPCFEKLFLTAFSGMMVPRLFDEEYQGIVKEMSQGGELLSLIVEGAKLIRSLFVEIKEEKVAILPHLPPSFFAGRFCNISHPLGLFHFEWTKKKIRLLCFECQKDGNVTLHLHPEIKSFRLRSSRKDRGMKINRDIPIELKSGINYLLDRFEK